MGDIVSVPETGDPRSSCVSEPSRCCQPVLLPGPSPRQPAVTFTAHRCLHARTSVREDGSILLAEAEQGSLRTRPPGVRHGQVQGSVQSKDRSIWAVGGVPQELGRPPSTSLGAPSSTGLKIQGHSHLGKPFQGKGPGAFAEKRRTRKAGAVQEPRKRHRRLYLQSLPEKAVHPPGKNWTL